MFYYLSIITTITGMFTLLDLFVEKRAKGKVAEYVFGFGTANLAGFEHSVITSLLSPFRVDGRISFKRVLFRYSGVISLIISVAALFGIYVLRLEFLQDGDTSVTQNVIESLISIPLIALFFWPFDCWSLWVTNKIFQNKASSSPMGFVWRVSVDIFVTLLPLIILLLAMLMFISQFAEHFSVFEDAEGDYEFGGIRDVLSFLYVAIMGALGANILGSLLITAVQIFTLVIGLLARLFLRLTKLNQHLAMVSSAPDFPFTFIGLLCGISVAGMTMVLT